MFLLCYFMGSESYDVSLVLNDLRKICSTFTNGLLLYIEGIVETGIVLEQTNMNLS